MNICWFGFLGKNHSWSIVGQNICRELIKLGHNVDMFSTNGKTCFPNDLLKNLKGSIEENQLPTDDDNIKYADSVLKKEYDVQLSYTAMKNFEYLFNRGQKNRIGIWNYETTVLPKSFAKKSSYVDYVAPSSNFSKMIFEKNGVPSEKQVVIPHGIDLDKFRLSEKYPLKTKKKIKVFANIAQPHLRKNIPGLFEVWGKSFTSKDDVCLVIKISKTGANPLLDISFNDIFNKFKRKYPRHAEIEIIDHFLDDIEPLYKACDVLYTMSFAECFWMPGLEGFASDMVVLSPRYGGQLDYMNDDNSVLLDGKIIRADNKLQYWEPSPYAQVFSADIDNACVKLKDVVNNYTDYHKKFSPNIKNILSNYTWENVANQFLKLCK